MAPTGVDPVTSRFSVDDGPLGGKPEARQFPVFIRDFEPKVIELHQGDLPRLWADRGQEDVPARLLRVWTRPCGQENFATKYIPACGKVSVVRDMTGGGARLTTSERRRPGYRR